MERHDDDDRDGEGGHGAVDFDTVDVEAPPPSMYPYIAAEVRRQPGMHLGDLECPTSFDQLVWNLVEPSLDGCVDHAGTTLSIEIDGDALTVEDDGPGLIPSSDAGSRLSASSPLAGCTADFEARRSRSLAKPTSRRGVTDACTSSCMRAAKLVGRSRITDRRRGRALASGSFPTSPCYLSERGRSSASRAGSVTSRCWQRASRSTLERR